MSEPAPKHDEEPDDDASFDFLDDGANARPRPPVGRQRRSGPSMPIIRKPVPVSESGPLRASTVEVVATEATDLDEDFDFLAEFSSTPDERDIDDAPGGMHGVRHGVEQGVGRYPAHDAGPDDAAGGGWWRPALFLVAIALLAGGGLMVGWPHLPFAGEATRTADTGASDVPPVTVNEVPDAPRGTGARPLGKRFREASERVEALVAEGRLDEAGDAIAGLDRAVYGYGIAEFEAFEARIAALEAGDDLAGADTADGTVEDIERAVAADREAVAEAERAAEVARLEAAGAAEAERLAEAERVAENERLAEVSRVAEAERLAEAERVAEAENLAEAERVAAAESLAEAERVAAAERLAEAERMAEAERLVEAERVAENARLAEVARVAEAERVAAAERAAETERQAERQAERVRVAEAARLAEQERLAEEERRAEGERLAEAARLAENERAAEAARAAESASASAGVAQTRRQRVEAERAEREAEAAQARADAREAARARAEGSRVQDGSAAVPAPIATTSVDAAPRDARTQRLDDERATTALADRRATDRRIAEQRAARSSENETETQIALAPAPVPDVVPPAPSAPVAIDDADLQIVYARLLEMREALEGRDIETIIALSDPPSGRVQQLMQVFANSESLSTRIANVSTSTADNAITGTLLIDAIRRADGSRIRPPAGLESMALTSTRDAEGWSALSW